MRKTSGRQPMETQVLCDLINGLPPEYRAIILYQIDLMEALKRHGDANRLAVRAALRASKAGQSGTEVLEARLAEFIHAERCLLA